MNTDTFHPVEAVSHERIVDTAQAPQWADRAVLFPLRYRLRLALSRLLISWGARLYVPPR